MNSKLQLHVQLQHSIQQDLLNSLLAEDFFAAHDMQTSSQVQQVIQKLAPYAQDALAQACQELTHFVVYGTESRTKLVIIGITPAYKQPWQIKPNAIFLFDHTEQRIHHEPSALMLYDAFIHLGLFADCTAEKIQQFRDDLILADAQSALSANVSIFKNSQQDHSPAKHFQNLEQYAALRDRPYHPLAKLKDGFSATDYQQYTPEFQQPITVRWVAVRKDLVVVGRDIHDLELDQPARIFLNPTQQAQLHAELIAKKIDSNYLPMPMHAWQFEHVLHSTFAQEIDLGCLIPLAFSVHHFYASSSIRTLISGLNPEDHLKLPLGIKALGSLRFLPIVKMINGQKNQQLLAEAKRIDPVLASRLWLCDEHQWWGFMPHQPHNLTPQNETLFEEQPMHLAAQRRIIPAELLKAPYQLIPMASLGQSGLADVSVFQSLFGAQLPTPEVVKHVFYTLCHEFFEINLRLFRLGLMGEIHGQNVCLVLKQGQFAGLLLRDHDSVRIHLPWMQQAGLHDPVYLSPSDFRITLYHDSVEELLVYLQTLGIQVNLASILESVARHYQLDEKLLWLALAQALKDTLELVPFSPEARRLLTHCLFEEKLWPHKQLLRPLLQQDNRVGSMPTRVGQTHNVLQRMTAYHE
ncbi:IucA/IucC family protein [Acinetobacter soli]|uniref:IucA/IucC family protein n=1 Tax=Acinetobacter soli TaxID=487316 RepID=UPI001ABC8B3F|nr:IucA/IucC family protein [Acinetobacter soli]MBO3639967.1 IucA/IucC family siderophore biosynthesis protein [Acinetobacter soli]WEH89090.1 IucA/IucC family protein [Acinetobacter soli]WEI09011.1 IucA/IucC family protein [Acinetobacter soli]